MPTWEEALGMAPKTDYAPAPEPVAEPVNEEAFNVAALRQRVATAVDALRQKSTVTYRGDGPEPPLAVRRMRLCESRDGVSDLVRAPEGGWLWATDDCSTERIWEQYHKGWGWDRVRRVAPGEWAVTEWAPAPTDPAPTGRVTCTPGATPPPPSYVVRLEILGSENQLAKLPSGKWWLIHGHDTPAVDARGWEWDSPPFSNLECVPAEFWPLHPYKERLLLKSLAMALPQNGEWYQVAIDADSEQPIWAWRDDDGDWDFLVSETEPDE